MCSAIQMVQHLPPHHDVHPLRARSLIVGGAAPALSRPQDQSEAFVAFLARCLAKAPEERATAAELLGDSALLRPENQPTGACLAEPLARRREYLCEVAAEGLPEQREAALPAPPGGGSAEGEEAAGEAGEGLGERLTTMLRL